MFQFYILRYLSYYDGNQKKKHVSFLTLRHSIFFPLTKEELLRKSPLRKSPLSLILYFFLLFISFIINFLTPLWHNSHRTSSISQTIITTTGFYIIIIIIIYLSYYLFYSFFHSIMAQQSQDK